MAKFEYKRIDEPVKKNDANTWLAEITKDGWQIKSYQEIPAHDIDFIRVVALLERPITKNRLFS